MSYAELKSVAEKGDPEAQHELGWRYVRGKDVLKDYSEAVQWWQKAAAQRYVPAEYNLGVAYGKGEGVTKDRQEGIKWVRMAADAGMPQAQETLGIIYCSAGKTPAQDYTKAFEWFKKAAQQGFVSSQYYVALCYRDGKGTPTNSNGAFAWFLKAASNGVANAQVELGRYYTDAGFGEFGYFQNTNAIEQAQTPFEMMRTNQNFMQAATWFRKAANQADSEGQARLANAYVAGFGVGRDLVEAYKWLTLANLNNTNTGTVLVTIYAKHKIAFTAEQISRGRRHAEEFMKTNQISSGVVKEIPGL
jgi:uncharacterized protein